MMRKRFWELGGSKMGDAVGVKAEEEGEDEEGEEGGEGKDGKEYNYREASQFAKHMKNKGKEQASSAFAQKLTLKQQREYLPVYTVRDELLRLVKDNQVLIVVGETGSGKTTQLAQYLHEAGYSRLGRIGGCCLALRCLALPCLALPCVVRCSFFSFSLFLSFLSPLSIPPPRPAPPIKVSHYLPYATLYPQAAPSRGALPQCPSPRASPRRRAARSVRQWDTQSGLRTARAPKRWSST